MLAKAHLCPPQQQSRFRTPSNEGDGPTQLPTPRSLQQSPMLWPGDIHGVRTPEACEPPGWHLRDELFVAKLHEREPSACISPLALHAPSPVLSHRAAQARPAPLQLFSSPKRNGSPTPLFLDGQPLQEAAVWPLFPKPSAKQKEEAHALWRDVCILPPPPLTPAQLSPVTSFGPTARGQEALVPVVAPAFVQQPHAAALPSATLPPGSLTQVALMLQSAGGSFAVGNSSLALWGPRLTPHALERTVVSLQPGELGLRAAAAVHKQLLVLCPRGGIFEQLDQWALPAPRPHNQMAAFPERLHADAQRLAEALEAESLHSQLISAAAQGAWDSARIYQQALHNPVCAADEASVLPQPILPTPATAAVARVQRRGRKAQTQSTSFIVSKADSELISYERVTRSMPLGKEVMYVLHGHISRRVPKYKEQFRACWQNTPPQVIADFRQQCPGLASLCDAFDMLAEGTSKLEKRHISQASGLRHFASHYCVDGFSAVVDYYNAVQQAIAVARQAPG